MHRICINKRGERYGSGDNQISHVNICRHRLRRLLVPRVNRDSRSRAGGPRTILRAPLTPRLQEPRTLSCPQGPKALHTTLSRRHSVTMNSTDRPRIESLDEAECWALLQRKEMGRLAVSANNKPDVFPVNFLIDGERLIIRTAPGHKFASAVLGEAVAFEVDSIDEHTGTGWSIVIKGPASEVDDLDDYLHTSELPIEPWAGGAKLRFLQITPTIVTGRRIPDVIKTRGAQPSELAPNRHSI